MSAPTGGTHGSPVSATRPPRGRSLRPIWTCASDRPRLGILGTDPALPSVRLSWFPCPHCGVWGLFRGLVVSGPCLSSRYEEHGKHCNVRGRGPRRCRVVFRSLRGLARRPRDRRTALCGGPSSEEHTSELQSLMRISYAVYCLKKNIITTLPNA